jgi:hypothetical protein
MSFLPRRSMPFLIVCILSILVVNHAAPASMSASAAAKPTSTEARIASLRTGMTWAVLGQQNGYVHVGADAQTNAYSGDTTIDQYLPLLCLLVDNRPAPSDISFDYYNGWTRGALRVTSPIQGAALTSQQQGNTICANQFGSGWRMAEFHDGWYGEDFSASGGWSYWGAGQIPTGSRFWTAINDQPANPWNSAGDLPPANDESVLKQKLYDVMQPMLSQLQNQSLRNLAYTAIARRFDGDDNVLLKDLIREAEQTGIVNPYDPAWQSLKAQIASFQNVNGTAYDPQIYIPNYQDGAVPQSTLTMVVYETDLTRTQLSAYQLDPNGGLRPFGQLVDEDYVATREVWVLAINEGIQQTATSLSASRVTKTQATQPRGSEPAMTSQQMGTMAVCNPTGLRNNMGREYFRSLKIPNPASVEHWTAGKLEPRLVIVGKGGAEITNMPFGKIKRKDIKNWYASEFSIGDWDRAALGDHWAYKWIEVDGGPEIELSLNLSAKIKELINVSVDVKATFNKKFDDMGANTVAFLDSTYTDYNTPIIYWNVCSVGGASGFDNLARQATPAASSTYPGYAVARINDGLPDTRLGGSYSWANAANTPLPQWVQLDFGSAKTFSRVSVFTTDGYQLRDFDIQVWNGATWITITSVNGNTASRIDRTFAPQSSRLIRILARSGPNHQPGYVRVNEFEVYP